MRRAGPWAGAAAVAVFGVVGLLGGCSVPTVSLEADAPATPPVSAPTQPAPRPTTVTPSKPAPPRSAPTETSAETSPAADSAARVLDRLPVKGRAPMTGYDRARFGQSWLDADRNGCDTRNDVLRARLREIVLKPRSNNCVVDRGVLDDLYTATTIQFVRGDGFLVDIDHVVALANAWVTGAFRWDVRKRAAFANDPLNLEPVDASTNRAKGSGDAATWLPPSRSHRCAYVARQVAVKAKYALWVTPAERAAVARQLTTCPDQRLPPDSGAPTTVSQNIQDPGDPAQPAQPIAPPRPGGAATHYENCDAVRAAGAAPLRRGQPGYASHLDREGDGVACE